LDATNLAPLYGGEGALVEQAARALVRRGIEARLALADTVGAAWGLARYGSATRLDVLPLAALRLPGDLLETLAHLGLASVGEVLALPREQLRSRFGPLLVERINQFTCRAPEVILAVDPPEEFAVNEAFEHPLSRGDAIQFVVERLLGRLSWLLAARRAGALAVTCRFECEGAAGAEFQFELFRPTACARCGWPVPPRRSRSACCGMRRSWSGKERCSRTSDRSKGHDHWRRWSIGSPGDWDRRRWSA
jgi:protein ImuB